VPRQMNLFGAIRFEGNPYVNEVFAPAEVDGLEQPFNLNIDWEIDYPRLMFKKDVRYCCPDLLLGPRQNHRGTFSSALYRFVSVLSSANLDSVRTASHKTSYRLAWAEEGFGLVDAFHEFSTEQLIWILGSGFSLASARYACLLMQYRDGWHLDLVIPSIGEIRPEHLILVQCNLK
jgi:hypothetical protein